METAEVPVELTVILPVLQRLVAEGAVPAVLMVVILLVLITVAQVVIPSVPMHAKEPAEVVPELVQE